jgi:mono/diheme cytochrome c family protein
MVSSRRPKPDRNFQEERPAMRLTDSDRPRAARLIASIFACGFLLSFAGPSPSRQTGTKQKDHYGPEVVGFRWQEADSVDDRWKDSDIGRFLASSLPLPNGRGIVERGLSIRVGTRREGTVCFDTGELKWRAAWTGGFLRFTPARFGLIAPPEIAGTPHFVSGPGPGWLGSAHYKGMYQNRERVVLRYAVSPVETGKSPFEVLESPWLQVRDGLTLFTRTVEVGATVALTMNVADVREKERAELRSVDGVKVAVLHAAGRITAVAVRDAAGVRLDAPDRGPVSLRIPAHEKPRRFALFLWSGAATDLPRFVKAVATSPEAEPLRPLTQPGPARWTASVVTKGSLAPDNADYVVDTITLPFDNPYKALLFVGGHDFFSNGDLALCTVHGDVWRVSGVNRSLEKLTWKRYATGLFQPLGLCILNDRVYVLGRDQITRLHDDNGDGEADYYENFCNLGPTSPGRHDYTTCLETDAAGNFYFLTALEGLVRVSPDGTRREILATGFRNPNGLGVGPGPVITVAPQEGNWTPASNVAEVRPGGYYGFGGPKLTTDRPLGYDPPLCWIPRRQDNSSGGQVWVSGGKWGPFDGQMIHLSYGQCRMRLTLREEVRPGVVQGGTVGFSPFFASGVMRGRFSPHDGQLYVSGLKGWSCAAQQDGCLQRVRYTGKPVDMPIRVQTMQNGVAISFSRPLDRSSAEDPGSFALEQWNYRYSEKYGSADYKLSDPRSEGHDEVPVTSATLLQDGKTVFLEIPKFRPVMQLAIAYALRSNDGASLRRTIYYTVNEVGKGRMDPAKLTRAKRPGLLKPDEEALLRPGLILRFDQGGKRDARDSRLAALFVPHETCPTPFLEPTPFRASFDGYFRVPLLGEFTFRLRGRGEAVMRLNGKEVLRGSGDLAAIPGVRVALRKGLNPITLEYGSPSGADAAIRLLWEGEDFAEESVPPTVFLHRGDDQELALGRRHRRGRELFATKQCFRCHGLPTGVVAGANAIPELSWGPPNLTGIGSRLNADWLARWILDPQGMDGHAAMPRMLDLQDPGRRQKAADLAAYLATLRNATVRKPGVDKGVTGIGARLYGDFGCIACHRLTPVDSKDPFGRRTLYNVNAKYRPGILESYLLKPHAHHLGSGMPDFRLSASEAASLSVFIRHEAKGAKAKFAELGRADPRRGRDLFTTLRCSNCHATGKDEDRPATLVALGNKRGGAGCLAVDTGGRGQSPVFAFSASDREALAAFLKSDGKSLARRVAPEESRRLVKALSCAACHNHDTAVSPRWTILDEEGSGLAPEVLPDLTWTGEKLRGDWTERFLSGKLDYRPRPTLKARMPFFPAHAAVLAHGLAAEHGIDPGEPVPGEFDRRLAEVGNKLTLPTGLDCRQCHALGKEALAGDAGTNIAVGIPFGYMRERLRREFYHRFVIDPTRYELQAKMPKLIADGKTTKATSVFGGDARQQVDAIWHFIQSAQIKGRPLPPSPPADRGRSPKTPE